MTQNRFYSSTTRPTTTTADPGTSGTSLAVADSTVFSSLDGGFPWTAAINWGLADQELVNVTARPDATHLTIVRGQDGTTGQSHPIGATVTHDVSARDFNEASAHVGATSGVHGAPGALVGTAYVVKTGAYTLTAADVVVAGDASAGAFTLTLPTAAGITGRIYTVKKIDTSTNALTIGTTSSQTIDGATTLVLRTPALAVQVVSDGSNWQVIDVTSFDPWHSMTLLNSWVNSAGNQNAKYRALGMNQVQVVGYITSGTITNSTTIATLPVGYRMLNVTNSPSQPIFVAGGSSPTQPPVIWLDSSGNIKIFNIPSGTTQLQFNAIFGIDG